MFDVCLTKKNGHFGHIMLRNVLQQPIPKIKRVYYYTNELLQLQNSLLPPGATLRGKVPTEVPEMMTLMGLRHVNEPKFAITILTLGATLARLSRTSFSASVPSIISPGATKIK